MSSIICHSIWVFPFISSFWVKRNVPCLIAMLNGKPMSVKWDEKVFHMNPRIEFSENKIKSYKEIKEVTLNVSQTNNAVTHLVFIYANICSSYLLITMNRVFLNSLICYINLINHVDHGRTWLYYGSPKLCTHVYLIYKSILW